MKHRTSYLHASKSHSLCHLSYFLYCKYFFQFYTSRHLSSYVASSEQFLVVLVVQAITLELSILSIALPMEGMSRSQVVETST